MFNITMARIAVRVQKRPKRVWSILVTIYGLDEGELRSLEKDS